VNDLLFLAHRIPFPPNKGDKLRSFNLLRYLSAHYRVHLGCFVDDPSDLQHVGEVRKYCAESAFIPLHPFWRRVCSLTGLLSGEALSVVYYRDARLAAWVRTLRERHDIRRVLVFSSVMAQYAEPADGARRIADMVDVDSAKWARYAKDRKWPMSWLYEREGRHLLEFETGIARRFDATVFVSDAEARLFQRLSGTPAQLVHCAGNGVDTEYFKPDSVRASPYGPGGRVIAFTGAMDYWPNVDAVNWFAKDIFPQLRQSVPDLRFAIVGARPSAEVRRLGEREGILVTGTVPDVRPYLEHAVAAVAPLRIARGVQNKVLEGMAMALPVVATPDAAEGLALAPGKEIIVARTSDEFVDSLKAILNGRKAIGAAARDRVLRSYSWEANLSRVRDLLEAKQSEGNGEHSERAVAA
jgi:sugar transferase (PEP-CTERM/EpsH1 system associated)